MTLAEFCDAVWSVICEPPAMANRYEWRKKMVDAFYHDRMPPGSRRRVSANDPLDSTAQRKLAELRERQAAARAKNRAATEERKRAEADSG